MPFRSDREPPHSPPRGRATAAALRYGSEDAITPGLAETRLRYAEAYWNARSEALRLAAGWIAAGRALPCHRLPLIRQFAHAIASTAVLVRAPAPLRKGASTMDLDPFPLDDAGTALSALGEDVVLLAFYRGGSDFPEDRYSVRLTLDGVPNGIQESAATASAALAKARAARARRRRALEAEAALRAEMSRRAESEQEL